MSSVQTRPRRGGRRAAVVIAALLVFAGTACFRAGFAMTKSEFVEQSDAACSRFTETFDPLFGSIFGKETPDMRAAAKVERRVIASIQKLLDERAALRPHPNDRRTIDAINQTERATFERFISDFEKSVAHRDGEALGAALQRADEGFGPADEAQRAYGFKVCGAGEEGEKKATTPSAASIPEGSPVVVVKDLAFRPATVRISVGQAVVWRFADGTIEHNVAGGGIQSPNLTKTTWSRVFDKRGDFTYLCTLHPFMKGTVDVR